LEDGGEYYAKQSSGGVCEMSESVMVTITIGSAETPEVQPEFSLCGVVTFADIPVTGYGIAWYETATGGQPLSITAVIPLGTHTYYVAQRGNNECESDVRAAVEITIDYCDDKLYLDVRIFLEGVVQPSGNFIMDGNNHTGNWMTHYIQDPALQLLWKLVFGYDLKLPVLNPYYNTFGVEDRYAQINDPNGPAGEVVDWVLVEIWGNITTTPPLAYDLIETRALLLKPDGTIRDTLNRKPEFTPYLDSEIRIVVRHRNHLAAISMDMFDFDNGTIQYDFAVVEDVAGTNTATHVYNFVTPLPVAIRHGVACLWAGDFDMNGIITDFDMDVFKADFIANRMGTYILSDVNMDAYSNSQDASFINENFARKRSSVCRLFQKR
jgi:hypothetical protein